MKALAYLREHGLNAENLMGDRIAVWPEEAITPALEHWIIEHKSELIGDLQLTSDAALIPWRLFIDGKCLVMLSPCKSPEEAKRSAQQRWPGKNVQVAKRVDA